MFDFDATVDRNKSDSAKWGKYRSQDIIPMWVADMDFPSPPKVVEALRDRVNHGIFGYGRPDRTLANSVRKYLYRSFDWQVELNWIIWLPGLVTGLNVACRSIGASNDNVLTTVPIYPPFLTAPIYSQRRLKTSRLTYSNESWQFDFDDLSNNIEADTCLFMLCNPHNPTGRVFKKDELLQLADICIRNDLVICSDEIHCDLVLNKHRQHLPIASLSPDIARRTVTLMAPSKTYNIPGLCCAYAIIPDDSLRRRFKQVMSGIVPHINVFGMTATHAAYEYGQNWLDDLIIYLRNNKDLVYHTISNLNGLEMGPVEATYLAWIDASKLNLPNPVKWFEKAGVGLSNGRDFNGSGFVRLNFGCPRPLLAKALNRISSVIEIEES